MPKQTGKPSPLSFAPYERVGLFIDGAELHATAKALGFAIDFKRLLTLFRQSARLICAHYYTLLPDDDTRDPIRQLVDWLEYNGFTTVTKRVRDTRFVDRQTPSGRMHIELAVDAMQLADGLDHIVIMSGNGDFRSLVAMLQGQGKRVSVLSTVSTRPAIVADDLRRQADHFVDLADLEDEIRR